MKRKVFVVVLAFIVVVFFGCSRNKSTGPASNGSITFTDANLVVAVRDSIGKPIGAIMPSDVAGLTMLYVPFRGIECLDGIGYLTALRTLRLNGNAISDISPLLGLTVLTMLWLDDNAISDVSPLSGLAALTSLGIEGNCISDVSQLSGLTALTMLGIGDNDITDLSPLSGLVALVGLFLSGNQIGDLSPLSGLTALKWLDLKNNEISDLSPLVHNSGLDLGDRIWLGGNPLSEEAFSEQVQALQQRGVAIFFD